jgi:hypothetical protein
VSVIEAVDISAIPFVQRELMMVKVLADTQARSSLLEVGAIFRAKVTLPRALVWKAADLDSRAKAAATLDLEVSVGWVSPSSLGLWGGHALLLSTGAALLETPTLPCRTGDGAGVGHQQRDAGAGGGG